MTISISISANITFNFLGRCLFITQGNKKMKVELPSLWSNPQSLKL
jgi:hypothetical protein